MDPNADTYTLNERIGRKGREDDWEGDERRGRIDGRGRGGREEERRKGRREEEEE